MKTIFSKVSVKDGLPTKDGDYITNIYHSTPFKKGDWIVSGAGIPNHFYKKDIQWWMKEIDLPSELELKEKAKEISENIYDDIAFRRVASDTIKYTAKWLMDFVLDVPPE